MGTGRARWATSRAVAKVAVFVGITLVLSSNATSARSSQPARRDAAPAIVVIPQVVSSVAPVGPTSTSSTSSTTAPPVSVEAATAARPLPAVTTNCRDALAYLAAHQAPGFVDSCGDGSALGHYGHTCFNVAGMCPDGAKFIHIACPAPFVYMNEAHNSWTLIGQASGFDIYGQGSPAERAFCDPHR